MKEQSEWKNCSEILEQESGAWLHLEKNWLRVCGPAIKKPIRNQIFESEIKKTIRTEHKKPKFLLKLNFSNITVASATEIKLHFFINPAANELVN